MSAAKTAHLCYYFAKKLCDIYKAVSIKHIKLTFPFIGQAKRTKNPPPIRINMLTACPEIKQSAEH